MALFDTIRAGSSGATDFEIERSLRFNADDGAVLARTPGSASNRRTMTLSLWVKGMIDDTYAIFDAHVNDSNRARLFFNDNGTIQFFSRISDSDVSNLTIGSFRDPTAWYHLVFKIDTTQSTASDRYKIFVNGVEQETNNAFPSQNLEIFFNSTTVHRFGIGGDDQGNENPFDGYMAEINFIDGAALDPTSFAETDTLTGQWNPIDTSSLTFGTNGFRLQFADNSNTTATTLGKDTSGNGNNYTPFEFSVSAGEGNDSVTDTPTNNFCTYNPLNKTNSVTLSNGHLKFSQSSNDQAVTGTMAITSGKWYYEFLKVSGDNPEVGIIATDSTNPDTNGGRVAFTGQSSGDVTGLKIALITNNGQQRNGIDYGDSGAITLTGGSAQTGAGHIGIAIDMDNSKIWYTDLSGNFFNSGDPANGTNAAYDFSSTQAANGAVPFVYFATNSGDTGSVNFGQQAFSYTQPAGFNSLCTQNLPEPTISKSDKYFDVVLYSGNDSTNNITGLNFSPDWVWIKNRNGTFWHQVFDTVRGVNRRLYTNRNATDNLSDPTLTAFNSDGFTLGDDDGGINGSGSTYVAWNWEAGDSTVTNTDGTISSQVRASTTAGFSIVSYEGNNVQGATVGHGLGVAPDAIIVKNRESTYNWAVWHTGLLNASYIVNLNGEGTQGSIPGIFNSTFPTSTVFSLGGGSQGDRFLSNEPSKDFIAYVFSSVEGFSKFGKYGGNGQSDGVYVHLGFRPALLIIKTMEQAGDWIMIDSTRDVDNPNQHRIDANLGDAETSNDVYHDFLATGFKLRTGSASRNPSNQEMLYFAFAENPFKYARAR